MATDTINKLNSKPVLYQIHSPQLSIHSTSPSSSPPKNSAANATIIIKQGQQHKYTENIGHHHEIATGLTGTQQLLITSTVPINPASEHIQGTGHLHESGNSRLRRTFGRLCALHHTKLLTIGNNKNDSNRNLSFLNDPNKNLNTNNENNVTINSNQIIECNKIDIMKGSQDSMSYYV